MGVRGGLARFGLGLASILFATGLLIMLLAHFLTRTLNHDEHQFVASGVLWARNGLLPYQDYAYFHVPFLTLIYAALFSLTDYFLLAARGFSTLCSWLLLLTLFGMARHHLRQRPWTGFAVGVGVALFLVAAPLFIYTSGRAWNHDLPILLTVWAVLVHLRGLDQQTQRWFWLSGLLIGLACATRLSFVPFLLPLGLAIWLWPGPAGWRARLLPTFGFGGGLLLGVAPALLFFILDPAGFWFGNFEYARLNTIYRITIGYERRMNLATKLAAFGDELLLREPGNLLILLTYLWLGRPRWGAGARVRARQLLLAGVILAALIGALAPTPSWPQYFYVLMPLLLLATLYGLVTERRVWLDQPWFGGVALAIVTAAIVLTAKEYEHVRKVFQPPSWFPVEFHATGQAMAALAGRGGPVLTLAPILALEGGLSIYAEMATGPFALRAAQLLPAAAGPGLHLPNVRTLDQWLQPQPPQAILTGVHPNQVADEAPLVDYARRQGYSPLGFDDGEQLWLPARAAWDEAIHLVTVADLPGQVAPGATITPTLFLKNVAPLQENLNISVRVVDRTGTNLVQSSGWPWGRPTSTWPKGELWYDGHTLALPATMPDGLYRLEIDFYDPAHDRFLAAIDLRRQQSPATPYYVAGYFAVGDWPPALAQLVDPPPRYAQAVLLTEFDLKPATPRPGDQLHLQLRWQSLATLDSDYTSFVHLVDAAGQLVAQDDHPPLAGFYPTSRWQPGQTLVDDYVLALPTALPPGSYTLYVGLYDPATGARLPVTTHPPPTGLFGPLRQRLLPRLDTQPAPVDAWPLTTITLAEP